MRATRTRRTQNICIITTNKPPSILQSSSSSSSSDHSSIQILDPQTGSILSSSSSQSTAGSTSAENNSGGGGASASSSASATSIKINSGVGIHSLHPIQFQNDKIVNHEHLYIAYGNQYKDSSTASSYQQQQQQQTNDGKDMYAYLLVQGSGALTSSSSSSSSTSSSSPKWKCKLPEYMSGKLITSPCGYYIIGGGKSGTCYCWSTLSSSFSSSSSSSSVQEDHSTNNIYNNTGSELVCKWIAHYRSIKSITFSDCGLYIITGGDDGIVNVWNLMDIVASLTSSSPSPSTSTKISRLTSSNSNNRSIHPIQTWSEHHLPITSIHTLPSSRIVSTSLDKQVIIMEIFNGKTLAKINMPCAITYVTSDSMGWRLYLGGLDGVIYCIDLNTYAIARTAESSSIISATATTTTEYDDGNVAQSLSGSMLEETILGIQSNSNTKTTFSAATGTGISNTTYKSSSYVTELRGHNRQISCLALLEEENGDDSSTLLVSGSIDGSIRIWDVRSRCCIRNIYPWSSNHTLLGQEMMMDDNSSNNSSNKNIVFPCSSITIIPRKWIDNTNDDHIGGIFSSSKTSNNGMMGRKRKRKKRNNEALADLIKPLERFTKFEQRFDDESNTSSSSGGDKGDGGFVMAFTKPNRKKVHLDIISVNESYDDNSKSVVTKHCRIEKDLVDGNAENNERIGIHNQGRGGGIVNTLNIDHGSENETAELQHEVKKLREEVLRWQTVNSKLMLKLKKNTN